MIKSLRFTNVNGSSADFNLDDNRLPVKSLTTSVDYRFTEKSRSQRHGIYPAETYMGKRLITAEGDLFGDNSADYLQRRLDLMNVLTPRPQYGNKVIGTLQLQLEGIAEELTAECTLDGHPELPLDASRGPAGSAYMIVWKTFDPRLYGDWQQVDLTFNPISDNIGGRGYNKTYPKIYTVPPNPGVQDIIVSNTGNIETFPTAVIYGPCTSPQITISRSDGLVQRFALFGLILTDVSDFVIIDFEKHTVIRGDGSNAFGFASGSDWWSLEPTPFTNIVRYSADIAGVPSHAIVKWRNAYNI